MKDAIRSALPRIGVAALAGTVVTAAVDPSDIPDWVAPAAAIIGVLATAALLLERLSVIWKVMWEARKEQAKAAQIMAQTVRSEIDGLSTEVRRLREQDFAREIEMTALRRKVAELEGRAMTDASEIAVLRRRIVELEQENKRLKARLAQMGAESHPTDVRPQ